MVTFGKDMPVSVREAMRGGAGSASLKALSPELPAQMRLFTEITLKPGCGIGYHVHEGETELFYFIQGSGRVKDDEVFVDVAAGDSMATPSGHGHSVENTGAEDLVFVAAIVLE